MQSHSRGGGIIPFAKERSYCGCIPSSEEQQHLPQFLIQREAGGTAEEWLHPLVRKCLIAVIADPFWNFLTESQ